MIRKRPESHDAEDATTSPESEPLLGIPSQEDVWRTLTRLRGGIELSTGPSDMHSTRIALRHRPEKSKATFDLETYRQYLAEREQDLQDLLRRVQLLKIRALGPLLTGIWEYDTHQDDWKRDENTFSGQLGSALCRLEYGQDWGPKQQAELQQAVSGINRHLPHEYQLTFSTDMTQGDAAQLYRLSLRLRYSTPTSPENRERIGEIVQRINDLEQQLTAVGNQGELFREQAGHFVSEERFRDIRYSYRSLLKEIAAYEEIDTWYSPTHNSSGRSESGTRQLSEPFKTDYQRFKMEEVEEVERLLKREYFGDTRGEQSCFLFGGGGLNALEAIFLALDQELENRQRIDLSPARNTKGKIAKRTQQPHKPALFVRTENIYFEVDPLIDKRLRQKHQTLEVVAPDDTKALIHKIKEQLPLAVFLAPLSNTYEMKVTDITAILEALSDDAWQEQIRDEFIDRGSHITKYMYLVIDDTATGRLGKWHEFDFSKLPEFVRIVSFDSLIKYGQDGQDLAPAALLTCIGRYCDDTLDTIRRQGGFMPPENTIRKMAATAPSDLTDRKLARHSRNAEFFTQHLQSRINGSVGGFFDRVIFTGSPAHPQHATVQRELTGGGAIVSVGLDFSWYPGYQEQQQDWNDVPKTAHDFYKDQKSIERALKNLIIALAKETGVDLNAGTSYGFNTTRLALYERVIPKGSLFPEDEYGPTTLPYIRVALGTENIKDAQLIAEVFARANDIFSLAIREHRVIALVSILDSKNVKARFTSRPVAKK